MRFPFRSRFNPLSQKSLLVCVQNLSGRRRRHDFVGIVADNPSDQFRLIRLPRFNGAGTNGDFPRIQPQFRLSTGGIRSVTSKTVFREDRPNLIVESDLRIAADILPETRCGVQQKTDQSQVASQIIFHHRPPNWKLSKY